MRFLAALLFTLLYQIIFSQTDGLEISPDGVVFPRMTNTEMNATTAVQGQCIYNTTFNSIYCNTGSTWKNINSTNDTPFRIFDSNLNTGIETELSPGDDKLRFFAGSISEVMIHDGKTLHMLDNGESVFVGAEAGKFDDGSDNRNSFIGHHAGQLTTTGANNVALGNQALRDNSVGNNNVAIGKQALFKNTDSNNVGVGLNAGLNSVTGQKNVLIGGYAGADNGTGKRNTIVGYEAGRSAPGVNPSDNVMIGHEAGKNETDSDRLYIANTDTNAPLIYGEFDTKKLQLNGEVNIGGFYNLPATPGFNRQVLTTDGQGQANWEDFIIITDTIVYENVNAINDLDRDTYIKSESSPDDDKIRIGVAGDEVMMHDGKTLHMYNNESVYIGESAGLYSFPNNNTYIGYKAGEGTPDKGAGNYNVALGSKAGRNITSGSLNTFIGYRAGEESENGGSNVAIGYEAGSESRGDGNVSIGRNAGRTTDGDNNVFIGHLTGNNAQGSSNIFLGSDGGSFANVSNQLFIGQGMNKWLIHGELDNKIFRVRGDLEIFPKDGIGTNSHLKMSDSSGNMDEVIRRSGTSNDVVMGDVENNGGSLHLRAAGATRVSVTPEGTLKYVPLDGPPGTCNSSRRGQVYYDGNEDKLKVCGKNLLIFGWHNLH